MTRSFFIIAFGVTISLSLAEVFTLSLAKVAQYSASLASTPTLTGSRILFTEAADDGSIDIVLSEELRGNIKTVLDTKCNSIDTQCVNSIKDLLINPRTELESRQLAGAAAAGAVLFALLALALPCQIDPAASAAQASTIAVITKTDAPFITITPKLDTPSATGINKPTQTTLSSMQDGHPQGDVAIYLSDNLANRLNEIIARTICEHIDAIVCAAKALVLNAFPGGPFADLASIQAKQPAWSTPDLVDATFAVVTFAVTQARYLRLTAEAATTLAFASFYVAYMNIKNNKPLGRVNYIASSDLQGSIMKSMGSTLISVTPTMVITATATASTSSALECSASCTIVGQIRNCNTWCPTPSPDDSYVKPSIYAVMTVAIEPWHVPNRLQLVIANPNPIGLCPPPSENETDFPLDLFPPVYTKFCEQAETSKDPIVWVVDPQGERAASKKWFLRTLKSRANEQYKDYRFTLARVPRADRTECLTSCDDAFRQLFPTRYM
ncbi:hypothetical protein EK21DRAFT_114118 [Setomelanomma holmii]|uniref:Uncharacterized protein n=1 Tax=Setomelanomma holmii TaxID=210430 RepID=A0A9P4H610_9PLEO|nr:hypothetical protein EK21DRAFT_114118 [Setomelanomma holmii]